MLVHVCWHALSVGDVCMVPVQMEYFHRYQYKAIPTVTDTLVEGRVTLHTEN